MEVLSLTGSAKTPDVRFEPTGKLYFGGRAIPENALEFFNPLQTWLSDYSKKPNAKTEFEVRLQYINTSASKCLLQLFRAMEEVKTAGSDVKINWIYAQDDVDMEELGEDFKQVVSVPFDLVKVDRL